MILLFDIGNTHTHVGLATATRIVRHRDLPTAGWWDEAGETALRRFIGKAAPNDAVLCSVVPNATPRALTVASQFCGQPPLVLTHSNLLGLGIDYPRPETIGPDRLANAVAARRYGTPVVVVDFGTAVTFDVVDRKGDYVGGVIAPGLAAMTDYLHEKTALLPRIRIREIDARIGRSTEEAMLIGAVHGYRGLIRGILRELRSDIGCRRLPVIATGSYAELLGAKLPEMTRIEPLLTLEGLRLFWQARRREGNGGRSG